MDKALASVLAEVSWREAFLWDSCMKCWSCIESCSLFRYSRDEVRHSPPYKTYLIKKAVIDRAYGLKSLFYRGKPDSKLLEKLGWIAFECLTCGRCEEACPFKVDTVKADMLLRRLVKPPQGLEAMVKGAVETGNPFGEKSGRLNWAPSSFKPKEKAEILWFIGCNEAYKRFRMARATLKILERLKLDFTVLQDEKCCGWPILSAGNLDVFKMLMNSNIESANRVEAKTIVTGCPGCSLTWKKVYPEYGGEVKQRVLHLTELIAELIDEGKVEFSKRVEDTVTFHDPCDLGRKQGVFEAPRKIIESIPGLKLVEMKNNRRASFCCGAGGAYKAVNNEVATSLAALRLMEAVDAGVKTLVTSCPACIQNFHHARRKIKAKVKILSIEELLDKAGIKSR